MRVLPSERRARSGTLNVASVFYALSLLHLPKLYMINFFVLGKWVAGPGGSGGGGGNSMRGQGRPCMHAAHACMAMRVT